MRRTRRYACQEDARATRGEGGGGERPEADEACRNGIEIDREAPLQEAPLGSARAIRPRPARIHLPAVREGEGVTFYSEKG